MFAKGPEHVWDRTIETKQLHLLRGNDVQTLFVQDVSLLVSLRDEAFALANAATDLGEHLVEFLMGKYGLEGAVSGIEVQGHVSLGAVLAPSRATTNWAVQAVEVHSQLASNNASIANSGMDDIRASSIHDDFLARHTVDE